MPLVVDDIHCRFGGIAALDGVSFALPPDLISCLIGPNGSGKTTLFNIATGVLRADEGDGSDRRRRAQGPQAP